MPGIACGRAVGRSDDATGEADDGEERPHGDVVDRDEAHDQRRNGEDPQELSIAKGEPRQADDVLGNGLGAHDGLVPARSADAVGPTPLPSGKVKRQRCC